jgi:CheY-like chemotaxis protein/anti-sigma regulatory factor (Ser/Thr protein kinase)
LEPVALCDVMRECQEMMAPSADSRRIQLIFPQDDGLHVRSDLIRLKQILLNLLSNAIKYNQTAGSVTVSCASVDSTLVRITIEDTGVGLDAAQMQNLFQPFNRLGQEAGIEEGTGIGLVLTKRLVELMGGELGVTSSPGVGSLFWVDLKRSTGTTYAVRGTLEPLSAQTKDLEPDSPVRTVLYVEDNPANLNLVREIIALRGDLKLLAATDGNLGVELARQHQPEVILMDINLPGISGIEALRLLRNDFRTNRIPVIALTANAMPRDVMNSKAVGFFRYLTKPIDIDELLDALDGALLVCNSLESDEQN